MSHAKVCQLEAQARAIADHWPDYDADFKYWYNPRCLFESPAKRVFVGINPRREGDSWKKENHAYLDYGCDGKIHNEWIDGEWAGEGPEHQRLARVVFEELYGCENWESKLRRTPCFNVMPLRSRGANDIRDKAWSKAVDWFKDVLLHLKPKTIICNGNSEGYRGKPGKSPWVAVRSEFDVETLCRMPYTANQGQNDREVAVKVDRITNGALEGTIVLGLPQLTWFGSDRPSRYLNSLSKPLLSSC